MRSTPRAVLLACLIPILGCTSTNGSPRWYGIDLRVAPGLAVSDRVTVHPTAAFATDVFGGEEGQSLKSLHLGGQVRYSTGSASDSRSLWFGGEFGTVHGYGAAGVSDYGSEGFYFRVGLDFQPAFLKR